MQDGSFISDWLALLLKSDSEAAIYRMAGAFLSLRNNEKLSMRVLLKQDHHTPTVRIFKKILHSFLLEDAVHFVSKQLLGMKSLLF